MDFATIGAFAAASAVLLTIPGPTALLIVSYALGQGRRLALATASGAALGDLVAMTASLAGLGALMTASAELFTAVKLIGAGYLVWMGVSMWRAAGRENPSLAPGGAAGGPVEGGSSGAAIPAGRAFRDAFVVTALNPKSIVFFVAFVPQFIDPGAAYAPQAAILVGVFVGLALANALGYALLAARLGRRLAGASARRWLGRAGGTGLLAMAGLTAAARQA